MAITDDLKQDAWSPDGDLPLVLLTIAHDDLTQPIRVVNDREDIQSDGNDFIAFAFEIALPDSLEDGPPQARLVIDNVSREIGQAVRDIATPATVTIQVVRRSAPDIIEAEFPTMFLRNVQYDALTVSGVLQFEDLTREPYPAFIFSPAEYPGLVQG